MNDELNDHCNSMEQTFGVCTECGSVLCLCGVCHVCEDRNKDGEDRS